MSAEPTASASLNPSNWVEEHGDLMFRFAYSRLRSADAAEEVVQESFVAALKASDQYEGRGSERSWLMTILRRKVVDYVRRRQKETTLASDDGSDLLDSLFDSTGHWRSDPRLAGNRPESLLENQEFWNAFRHCLKGLPQRQADVFSLRELDGCSTEEICKDLEVTSSNLWVLLHRARLALAKCLKGRWQD